MAQKARAKTEEEVLTPERLKKRLDNLDQRLDAIDTMVTALAERMMNRPASIEITCPSCGRVIQIALVGNEKMMI